MIHTVDVVDVLGKNDVKEPHGYFKVVQTIAAERAFRPAAQSLCKKTW